MYRKNEFPLMMKKSVNINMLVFSKLAISRAGNVAKQKGVIINRNVEKKKSENSYSSLTNSIRIYSLCLRFIAYCRRTDAERRNGQLTTKKLKSATEVATTSISEQKWFNTTQVVKVVVI